LRDYFKVNTDHKVIGVQYLVTTFFFFFAGGLIAMIMRAELAQPGTQIVDPSMFNGLFSTHAALMIFVFVIPAFAGIANYVLPLMIGAPDMAFPRLNALSYWMLPVAGTLFLASYLPRAARSPRAGRPTRRSRRRSRSASSSSRSACSSPARHRSRPR
jgi:cytochrome c oxidase subunit 1